jgi:microcystin-dependent protein
MADGFIGEIRLFAGDFAPQGWALCEGQLLAISQHTALFTILGTTYGGDGKASFALPDLRGRVPLHPGQGAGLSARRLAEKGGAEAVTLTAAQMPSHTHAVAAASGTGTSASPTNNVWAASSKQDQQYSGAANSTMQQGALASAGGGQAHDNMPPYLGLNYIISPFGIFPSPT